MGVWRDLLGTLQNTFRVGVAGPLFQRVGATARLQLPNALRWLDGGIAEVGSLTSDSAGDMRVLRHNYSAVAAPTPDDDILDGYEVGSIWIDLSTDRAYLCVDATATLAIWRIIGASDNVLDQALSSGVDIPFFQQASDYNEYGSAPASPNYDIVATAIFPGSAVFSPSHIKIIGSHSGAAGDSNLQVRRASDGGVIATINWTAELKSIHTALAPFTNVPAGEDMLELFIQKNGSSKPRLHYFQIK